jgi:hypothetical protein
MASASIFSSAKRATSSASTSPRLASHRLVLGWKWNLAFAREGAMVGVVHPKWARPNSALITPSRCSAPTARAKPLPAQRSPQPLFRRRHPPAVQAAALDQPFRFHPLGPLVCRADLGARRPRNRRRSQRLFLEQPDDRLLGLFRSLRAGLCRTGGEKGICGFSPAWPLRTALRISPRIVSSSSESVT